VAPFEPAALVPLSESGSVVRRVGTKGSELVRLAAAGIAVPETWILEASEFHRYVDLELPRGHDPRSILKLSKSPERLRRVARARERIEAGALDPELLAILSSLLAETLRETPLGLAVRMSSTCEDATIARAAGLTGSVLGVRTPDALAAAVKSIWARVFSPRAMAYLQTLGARDLGAAVVFQRMVAADHTGRLFVGVPRGFEADAEARRAERVAASSSRSVEAGVSEKSSENKVLPVAKARTVAFARGFGVPADDGSAAFDLIALDGAGQVLRRVVAQRERHLALTQAAAAHERLPVTDLADVEGEGEDEGLAAATLASLTTIAQRVEDKLPDVFSIVFVEARGEVFALGAHPKQGRGFPRGGQLDTVWSRAYVGDLLPGVVTPLTWSVAAPFAERGLRKGLASIGCSVPRDARFIAGVHGRMYLHVSELVRVVSAVPLVDPSSLVDVAAAGPIPTLDETFRDASHRSFYARLPLTVARLIREQARMGKVVDEFDETMIRARRIFGDLDLAILPDDALVPTLRDVSGLLERVGELHLSAATGFLTTLMALTAAVGRGGKTSAAHLAQTLAVGIPDLQTVKPVIALARLVGAIRTDDDARTALLEGATGPSFLPEGPGRRAFDRFLLDFGHRGVRETELSRPRFSEDPSVVASMVRACLGRDSVDPDELFARARSLADHELALAEARLTRVEVALVRSLVSRTQKALRLREHLRDALAFVLTMLRQVIVEIDRRLIRVEASLEPGSAFFCTFDELIAALRTGRPDLAHVVRLRRIEHQADIRRADPPLTFVGTPSAFPALTGDGLSLRGVAGSPGTVTGRARLCRHGVPEGGVVLPGEILVCRTADVAIAPYLLVAGGLVVEQGGSYASAMVVARELSVPAIGYVSGAMALLRTGNTLVLDGGAGVVTRP
jgi:rifampicin phosphotransferase